MTFSARFLLCCALLGSTVLLNGCPPNPGDKPGVNPVIQLGSPPPDTTNNGISIATADVTRSGLTNGTSIRLIASATAPIFQDNGLTWQCSFGPGSQTIGVVQTATLAFSPTIPTTAASASSLNVDSVVDPVAMTGCSMPKPGWGPVNIRGWIRVKATNSAGTTTSFTFLFDYQDVGTHPGQ